MSWTSGFFNSVNGDRTYNAEQMSAILEGLITNGVYESVGNKLVVQTNGGMVIKIGTGRGWFNKHWVNNDAEYLLTVDASDVTLNRYCAVCIRVDDTQSGRTANPVLKYSELATAPVKPTMTRTETVNEYCLAYIYIPAGSSAVTAGNIEDTRGNNNLCGWVTGLIEQLSTTTLFEQWEALFTEWFSSLQDLINENTEAMLVSALPTSLVISIPVSAWQSQTGGGYKTTLTVTGMTPTKSVISEADNSSVVLTDQSTNELTFTADSIPTEAVSVKIVHMGV